MINGFRDETLPLTEEEVELAKYIAKGLRVRIGKQEAITSSAIVKAMKQKGYSFGEPRLRKMINYIRINKLVNNLVASSKGYYVSTDPVEIKVYMESLKQRAEAILAVRDSFQSH